ncbi:MAG TPA: hypothetical protein VKX17_15270 [Planctomycetota bacterium]|nr:hypothetical protein [Planctomycetota bacterium]
MKNYILIGAIFCTAFLGVARLSAGEIDVILWFDTEDYLLPADDDATKRLCDLLTAHGIRATFKLVGEKARVLEKRHRDDVIAALQKHDIGYHSDFHSVHPTPSEYLAECGFIDGVAEFTRREAKGAADVRRILGVDTLVCYGQPGSSWGCQAIAALKEIGIAPHGIPCYVDDGSHVGLDEKPFWYCGAINVYHLGKNTTRIKDLHDPNALAPAKEKVTEIAERLRAEGGGLISIYYHPCEWVHRQFWDGVNFSRGANPPAALWKAPPQRTEAETDAAFARFGEYIDHIKAIKDVRFVTASDLPELYPDKTRVDGAPASDVLPIAERILDEQTKGADMLRLDDRAYSVADQFELLTQYANMLMGRKETAQRIRLTTIMGPDSAPPPHSALTKLQFTEFAAALRDVTQYLETQHRIPPRVFIGADAIPPADFLTALAGLAVHFQKKGSLPALQGVEIRAMELLPAKHIAEDTPNLFGGWIIHKEGFRAPKILDVAKLQTWTLKPAIRGK